MKKITNAQEQLDEVYINAEATYIKGEIDNISTLLTAKQHTAAWK